MRGFPLNMRFVWRSLELKGCFLAYDYGGCSWAERLKTLMFTQASR